MTNPNQSNDDKQEKPLSDKEVKDNLSSEKKLTRLAERKGQRPAFPFRRKPV